MQCTKMWLALDNFSVGIPPKLDPLDLPLLVMQWDVGCSSKRGATKREGGGGGASEVLTQQRKRKEGGRGKKV